MSSARSALLAAIVIAAISFCDISRLEGILDLCRNRLRLHESTPYPSNAGENASFIPTTSAFEPWTHEPVCVSTIPSIDSDHKIDNEYCVFTNANFRCGRGVSIVTTRRIAASIASSTAFSEPKECGQHRIDPPYEIVELPGRGFGLLANRTIERSELLMLDSPTFILNSDAYSDLEAVSRTRLMWKGVNQLPDATRELTLGMAKHAGGDEIEDIIGTNAFIQYFGTDVAHNTILREAAVSLRVLFFLQYYTIPPKSLWLMHLLQLLNHDCRPK
jgi:hypothetical protein